MAAKAVHVGNRMSLRRRPPTQAPRRPPHAAPPPLYTHTCPWCSAAQMRSTSWAQASSGMASALSLRRGRGRGAGAAVYVCGVWSVEVVRHLRGGSRA